MNIQQFKIGDIIDCRSDGSIVYMSHKGVLNLDNGKELDLEIAETETFLNIINETLRRR